MRLLVVYDLWEQHTRQTVLEHLYSFQRHAPGETYYLNARLGVPGWLKQVRFDVVVFHYTFTANKWARSRLEALMARAAPLEGLGTYRVAICQDEYINSDLVNEFLRRFSVHAVVTCLDEVDWERVYPRAKSGLSQYLQVAPGYVDESALTWVEPASRRSERAVDVGYRARDLPFWLGKHGQLKTEVARRFQEAAQGHLTLDISCDDGDTLYGDDWYRFLLSCKATLGCEGGASLHDPTGALRDEAERFLTEHPTATFAEVEQAAFPGLDGNLQLQALSPRHFEAAMTRTCQVLVAGRYMGAMQAGTHYLELARDWSNLEQVVQQVGQEEVRQRVVDNAYRDLVASKRFTYAAFVDQVLGLASDQLGASSASAQQDRWTRSRLARLRWREEEQASLFAWLETVAGAWRRVAPYHEELFEGARPKLPAIAARLHGTAQSVLRKARGGLLSAVFPQTFAALGDAPLRSPEPPSGDRRRTAPGSPSDPDPSRRSRPPRP